MGLELSKKIKKSWQLCWRYPGVLVGSQLAMLGAQFLLPSWIQQIPGVSTSVQWGINIGLFVASTFIALGYYRALIKTCEGKTPLWSDLTSEYEAFGSYLLGSIAYTIMGYGPVAGAAFFLYQALKSGGDLVGPVLSLLVVGTLCGLLLARVQFFVWFLLRSQGLGAALRSSWDLTRGRVPASISVLVATQLVYFAGIVALGLGTAVSMPVSAMASFFVLQQFEKKHA